MASRPMTDELNALNELKNLISRTESVVNSLLAMLPPKGAGWLEWRVRSMQRRLDDAKRELHKLTEAMQVQMIEKVVEERQKVEEVLKAQSVMK